MKKVLSVVMIAVMCVGLALTGCDKPGTSSEKGEKIVGIAMPNKSLERWNHDSAYLTKQFEKAGYKVKITYSDNDSDQQVNDIQNLISDGVSILIVAAIDGDTLSTCLADAKDQNIPVIAYDRLIMNTDAVSYYVSFDNYKVGTLQGQYVEEKMDLKNAKANGKKYNIEFTAGDPADNNAKFFYNGARDTLKKYIDDGVLEIKSKQDSFEECAIALWDTPAAMDRMQNILASYYADGTPLDICVCSNDAVALGVTQAIESDYKGDNQILITGQDCDDPNLENILDGKQSMSVYKVVSNEAKVTLDLAIELLKGKKVNESLIKDSKWEFDCVYDTKSYNNGKLAVPSFLLKPEIVTKDNYKQVLVDPGFYIIDSDGYLKAAN